GGEVGNRRFVITGSGERAPAQLVIRQIIRVEFNAAGEVFRGFLVRVHSQVGRAAVVVRLKVFGVQRDGLTVSLHRAGRIERVERVVADVVVGRRVGRINA